MTIVIETFIFCDGNECDRGGESLHYSDAKEESARRQLKGSGWLSKGGKHYCEACRKKVC